MELCNAFTELNDPDDQRERFLEQGRASPPATRPRTAGRGLPRGLEHGMPPTGGLGIGVDRLAMVFTGASIREVMLFPALRG